MSDCLVGTGVHLVDYRDKAGIYFSHDALSNCLGHKKWLCQNPQGFNPRQASDTSILGPGAVFGAVETGQSAQGEFASAQGTVQAYRISAAQFDKFLSGEPDFAQFVTSSLCRRKNALQRRLFGIMNRKVECRLAALLWAPLKIKNFGLSQLCNYLNSLKHKSQKINY